MQEVLAENELFRNIAMAIAMLLFIVFAVSRIIYPKLFSSIYSFDKFLNFRYREDFGSGIRLFSTESFYFTGVLSLSFSFGILCIYFFHSELRAALPWLEITTLFWGIAVWLILGVAIQFVMFLKFLFVRVFGWLFNIPAEETRHFQEFQSFNHSFSILLYAILSISIYVRFNFPMVALEILAVVLVIYLVFRLINLFFKIRSLGACSNLYIFSYLCTTELMPTLIGLKLIT
ncbi:hypothetical protein AWW68_04785 [Roseivirga spongicola]|jgi:hypothetical protein|uniref:DUF4271 domain-containing protein n=1 Tax=Roseivirga spongicola TaxID=333140 RepID=A0A150XHA6_9BACT|nr:MULTISPECIES: DUF4271 domain-containing protein [Roseivirga]KYG78088.1 hypothetical protein AWW68_04785 [Roseivirga spongicola]MBO6497502.1 DUF4271 domain-containing protein [Roseivirga sp.]MBO6661092.1 DUF4271 domain-containing protein [Roseivirga sp.]MBO6908924.1 DUF4271 domain-containing protein [Roseivirga sp.]